MTQECRTTWVAGLFLSTSTEFWINHGSSHCQLLAVGGNTIASNFWSFELQLCLHLFLTASRDPGTHVLFTQWYFGYLHRRVSSSGFVCSARCCCCLCYLQLCWVAVTYCRTVDLCATATTSCDYVVVNMARLPCVRRVAACTHRYDLSLHNKEELDSETGKSPSLVGVCRIIVP